MIKGLDNVHRYLNRDPHVFVRRHAFSTLVKLHYWHLLSHQISLHRVLLYYKLHHKLGFHLYQLCEHMEPSYHQLEFDLRLYLTQVDLFGKLYS